VWLGVWAGVLVVILLIIFVAQNTAGVEINFLWMSGRSSLALAMLMAGLECWDECGRSPHKATTRSAGGYRSRLTTQW
jgi:hypothetical protein